MRTRDLINGFLRLRRFAIVGVSRQPQEFSRKLLREFLQRGYDVIPVNPNAEEIEGKYCFARVQDINPPVTSALLMTSPTLADAVFQDCARAGVTLVWVYGISGSTDLSPNTQRICDQSGMRVIPGYCPYMFIPETAFYHRMHSFVWKMIGRYPR